MDPDSIWNTFDEAPMFSRPSGSAHVEKAAASIPHSQVSNHQEVYYQNGLQSQAPVSNHQNDYYQYGLQSQAPVSNHQNGHYENGLQSQAPVSNHQNSYYQYGLQNQAPVSNHQNGHCQNGLQSQAPAQLRQTAYAPIHLPLPPMNLPDPFVRSTTPEVPLSARLSSTNPSGGTYCAPVPGGFASNLASALPIPRRITRSERERRRQAMLAILTPAGAHPLPPPSPRVESAVLPDADFEKAHQVRQEPRKVTIMPLAARPQLEGFRKIEQMAEGPAKEAAKLLNNDLAAVKTANNKMRNNIAASRCRDKKKRAIVARSEEIATLQSELAFWKARAVGTGAGVDDWDRLDGNVRRGMIADRRFDAFDFSKDATGDERAAELAEKQNKASFGNKKKDAKGSKKRKAQEIGEAEE